MTNLQMHIEEAKTKHERIVSAKEFLARIITENPGIDEETLYPYFLAECKLYDPQIRREWYTMNYRLLTSEPRRKPYKADPAKVEALTAEIIANAAVMAMSLTCGQCLKLGGNFAKVGSLGTADQMVRDIATLDKVTTLMAT